MRFFDGVGGVWTLYDCRRMDGRIRKTAFASPTAVWRVFVSPEGRRFAYRFDRADSRELAPGLLRDQLARARWAGVFRPNSRYGA